MQRNLSAEHPSKFVIYETVFAMSVNYCGVFATTYALSQGNLKSTTWILLIMGSDCLQCLFVYICRRFET